MMLAFNRKELILQTRTFIQNAYSALNPQLRRAILKRHLDDELSGSFNERLQSIDGSLQIITDIGEEDIITLPIQPQGSATSQEKDGTSKYFDGFVRLRINSEVEGISEKILHVTEINNNEYDPLTCSPDGSDSYSSIAWISPNIKIAGAMGDELTGGGPGALPIAVDDTTARSEGGFVFLDAFEAPGGKGKSLNKGNGVTVAVLDNYCIPENPPENCLYDSLLQKLQNSQDDVTDFTWDPANDAMALALPHYHYPVPDHGIFVAGIIHSIAPEADIKMYPILDAWGTGDAFKLITGLLDLINDIQDSATHDDVIINMSCMFTRFDDIKHYDLFNQLMKAIFKLPFAYLDSINKDDSNPKRIYVVTSVGNEKGVDSNFKSPEYPARYNVENIIGVAAARFGAKPTTNAEKAFVDTFDETTPEHTTLFSNGSDLIPEEGFITFGGEVVSGTSLPRRTSQNGIIGIYLTDYPLPFSSEESMLMTTDANTSGWARWAGTSFAAPVISAALACAFSRGDNVDSLRMSTVKKLLFPAWQCKALDACSESMS